MINDHADRTGTREVAAALMMSAFDLFMLEGATPKKLSLSMSLWLKQWLLSVWTTITASRTAAIGFVAKFYQKRRLRLRNGIIPR